MKDKGNELRPIILFFFQNISMFSIIVTKSYNSDSIL